MSAACLETSEITLDVSNGQTLALALPGVDSATTATAVGIAEIGAGRFGACPICLDPDASFVEHVPPRAFAGTAMTWTCGPCNNDLGSRTEAAMQDWFDDACRIRVTVNGVQPLTNDRALIRKTADGQVVFMLDQIFAEHDDRFAEHMQPGSSGHPSDRTSSRRVHDRVPKKRISRRMPLPQGRP